MTSIGEAIRIESIRDYMVSMQEAMDKLFSLASTLTTEQRKLAEAELTSAWEEIYDEILRDESNVLSPNSKEVLLEELYYMELRNRARADAYVAWKLSLPSVRDAPLILTLQFTSDSAISPLQNDGTTEDSLIVAIREEIKDLETELAQMISAEEEFMESMKAVFMMIEENEHDVLSEESKETLKNELGEVRDANDEARRDFEERCKNA
ncbi:hypothetical protein B0T19DRAFT_405352 [Cercophora scortea]|uniref:Uncharacterized protein n=1 Tax=Cercophora scortea TaxID=314031 RepID=A0AAE0M4K5_9PEZI|nr:hypothetical protein B0T19DRAFT_405352 [Cercophora scortea]